MNNTLTILYTLVPALLFTLPIWRIFLKANKSGWRSLVPVYNLWELFSISGVPKWLALFSLPPYIYLIVYLLAGFSVSIGANFMLFILFNRYADYALLATVVITTLIYAIAINKLGYRFGKSKKFSLFVLGIPPVVLLILVVLSAIASILEAMSGTSSGYTSLLTVLYYVVTFVVLVGLYILAYGKSKYQDPSNPIAEVPVQPITQPVAQYPSQPIQQVVANPAPQSSQPIPTQTVTTYAQPTAPQPVMPAQQVPVEPQIPTQYQPQPTQPVVFQPEVQPPIEPPQPPSYV